MIATDPITLARHARDLAAAFGILLKEEPTWKPEDGISINSAVIGDVVIVAPIIEETTYAVALHEIGHVLAPLGRLTKQWSPASQRARRPLTLRDWNLLIECESAAWDAAQQYALCWTPVMDALRTWALGTYVTQRATWVRAHDDAAARRVPAREFAKQIRWQ